MNQAGAQIAAGFGQALQQGGLGGAAGAIGLAAGPAQMSAGGYPKPTMRNAVMTLVIPFGIIVAAMIFIVVATAFNLGILSVLLSALGFIAYLVAIVLPLVTLIKMSNELKAVTRNESFAWWPILIPIYQLIWLFSFLPQEVAKAKQIANVQTPTRGVILYLLLSPYALASDLNDIAAAP